MAPRSWAVTFVKALRDALAGSDQTAGPDESELVGAVDDEDDD